MADYTVLAEVGEALVRVLWEEIQVDGQVNALIDNESRISLRSPFDLREDDSVRLSLYLYRIVEDPYTKNQMPVPDGGRGLRKPPLTLDLYYLMTPLLGSPREQQIVLGKAMQVLYDRALIEGTDLGGSLADIGEDIRVILNPVTLEETTRVWQALEMGYRLSVCYVVRVAFMSSTRRRAVQPVVGRASEYAG